MASAGASWALKAVRAPSTSAPALASGKERLASSSRTAFKMAHDVKKAAAAWSEVERRLP